MGGGSALCGCRGMQMKITCPNCQRQFEIDQTDWSSDAGRIFQADCPGCQVSLQVAIKVDLVEKKPVEERAASPATKTILVAVDGEATCELIREMLLNAGYNVLEASGGREALSLLEKHHPPLALLDVGLSQTFGSEGYGVIKRNESLKNIKVILVAAIHQKSGYSGEPTTLYGAEDFIERHCLRDQLLSKVERLLNGKNTDSYGEEQERTLIDGGAVEPLLPALTESPPLWSHPPAEELNNPINVGIGDVLFPPITEKSQVPNNTPEHEAARRLARIIVSDIALYNPARIKEVLQGGNFYETLKEEMEEGRKLYNERVSALIRSHTDYFHEAIESFIKDNKS